MFRPKTIKINKLAVASPGRISELEGIFQGSTNVYIDYANVRPWADRLKWHVDLKRLKQFMDSFDNIKTTKIYVGTLVGDQVSEDLIKDLGRMGYDLTTKPVKRMRKSIDVSSISPGSPDILNGFIRKPLLSKFKVQTIMDLNNELAAMNKNGVMYLEDLKCNFDVEIGRDMLRDYDRNGIDTFVLWSGDSDFAGPVEQLLNDGKNVSVFATARKFSVELSALSVKGLRIYDINKVRNFICWNREIN